MIIIPCQFCNGLTVIPRPGRAHDTEEEKCPECEGSGGELIEAEPIELEDLEEMCGGNQ